MEKTQYEFLNDRINAVSSPSRHHKSIERKSEPLRIQRARKIIEQHEIQLDKIEQRKVAEWRKARHKAQEALHRGNYDQALATVQRFEYDYGSDE